MTAFAALAGPASALAAGAAPTLVVATTPDDQRLSGVVVGREGAPEILFLHGLGQSRLSWDRQLAGLSDRFRMAAFDMRGHGQSSKPSDPAAYGSGRVWADDVQAMIQAAGFTRPTLVGWSIGGRVTGHNLRHHGSRTLAGVLLVAPVTRMSPEVFKPRSGELGALAVSDDLRERARGVEETIEASFGRPVPDEVLHAMIAASGMAAPALFQGYGGLAQEDVDPGYAGVQRLRVIAGAHDQIIEPEMSRRLLDVNPRAVLSIYDRSGHAPFFDEAERFNAELAAFVSDSVRS